MEHLDAAEITRFLRGQLSAERSSAVERHLAACAQCAERLSSETDGVTEAPPGAEVSYATGAVFATPGPAPAPAPSPEPPATPQWVKEARTPERGEQVGRYLILERVGQGGMGIVYAAWDPDLGRRVAIKLLRTDKQHAEGRTIGQARLLREAQAMARVSHPHVISVFDVGTLGEGVFVAMEFVDGTTLKKWVKDAQRPWHQMLDTFLAAGRGLAGAHDAGLVHRDFKPDNVLIGKDGRVRVTDFGLARMAEDGVEPPRPALPEGALDHAAPELVQVTLDGHAVGTLMYMSPEQRRGEAPDARADQFSFCVALYWALFGVWPFDRQRSSARDADSPSSHKGTSRPSQRTGDPRPVDPTTGAFEPPRDSKVPAFIKKAILRGLSPEPTARFPSMDALLARLEYRPRVRRMAAAAAAVTLVALGGAYALHARQAAQSQALLCTGAEQQLAGIWGEAARRQVTEGLVATGRPEAADVAARVTSMLDDYGRAWVEASTEACRATRIRGEQTEQLLSLRVVCLERRLQDVKAVAGVLAAADTELVPKAVDTVSVLPSLRGCADVATLGQVEPPPDSPKAREEIERISGQLSQLKAMTDAGRYKQAKEIAEQALKAASELRYRPLEAEALLGQGVLEARSADYIQAERHLHQAVWAAHASRSDAVLARATSMIVFTLGYDPKRIDDALQWSELAKASITRMGGNEELEVDVEHFLGNVYSRANRLEESLAHLERSLQLAERILGKEHVRRAGILMNLGVIYRKLERFEDALAALREGIVIREKVNGPNHPSVGSLNYAIAQVLLKKGDFEEARIYANKALEIRLATFGPEHAEVGDAHDVVGAASALAGKNREALESFLKGMAIKEKALGKEHRTVAFSAAGAGMAYLQLGDPARAVPLFERILAINTLEQQVRGDAFFGIAQALDALNRKEVEVLDSARKAREAFASVKDSVRVAEIDDWLAQRAKPKGKTRAVRHP
ncbi:tetratricopeptide repeat protein [Hyalangium sp.]|uniref:tetratricopeptide repeat protein n=1 Tax=Hyalangium sp. TaxID=2028555 RepID=UPI002D2EC3E5|nr:tetratricopeptide repeat protein [Hyalangium sp.]HYH97195.1 tetratricopeptide repeat protein [Hyalangium sp.]